MNVPAATSSLSPAILALAEPPARLIDTPAMDYFLIEVVNALRESSAVAVARTKKLEQEMVDAGLLPPPGPSAVAGASAASKRDSSFRDSIGSGISRSESAQGKSLVDDEEEGVRQRLEAIGMHVGANIAERLCHDRSLFTDTLDAVKFVCKDLWSACWDKQVDNLRTNHRGVYVLQDNAFKPITRLSTWEGRADGIRRAKLYVAMPGGIIRGALARLGFQAAVIPEITQLPQCTFQVKLPKG
ncbi:TRAPP complex subunit trs33 [Cristinia sonorae]|uniref:TRAPP complex subunit trs33 n=1 Tax=Cristinia sonorae TaxID=1940300 RepID=A0A8K0UR46_9AGAR|nr:TRAPP complex subunit trs33 [Cristinia sonorae]